MSTSLKPAYTADGRLIEAEQFYALACDPARNVVVEACAGAGKTWMLVSRIMRALLAGAQPQEIVAITFTRKAAGEMRERLADWLREYAEATPEQRVLALRQRGMTAAEAARMEPALASLQQQLLTAGRQVEIRTFHAWFTQLLRAAPLELLEAQGISPELQLLEDESELMPDLWKRFHQMLLDTPELLQTYRDLSISQGRNKVQAWLEAGFAKRVEIRLASLGGTLLDSVPGADSVAARYAAVSSPIAFFTELRPGLAALASILGGAKTATPKAAAEAIEQALSLEDERAFKGVWGALFTASGTPKKRLGEAPELAAMCDQLLELKRAMDQHEARDLHLKMCKLTLALIDEFEGLKRARGFVDMNDLERGALALLGDPIQSGWVQQRLDARVKHLLIDEFQDTSPLQWHALHACLEGYVGAGGGTSGQAPPSVFIVGDPKQSIYRFRRAEPRVFAAAAEFVRSGLDGVVLACDHTRRNDPAVLNTVNQVFLQAVEHGQYEGFRPHTTEHGEGDAQAGLFSIEAPERVEAEREAAEEGQWRPSLTVPRSAAEQHTREPEAKRIAAYVAGLVTAQGVKPGDVFVLARKREGLRVLAHELRIAGVPYVAPEDVSLTQSADVQDMLAVLDVLASHGHNLSLAHALRSPLFGASEEDLLQLARMSGAVTWLGISTEEAKPATWWDALHSAAPGTLSAALERARDLLAAWATLGGSLTPHELIDRIVEEGGVRQRIAAAVRPAERHARLGAMDALLAAALDLDGGRYQSLYGFVRALRARSISYSVPMETDAVQLLTIHGAKGLEAKVVILMDSDAPPARAETSTVAVAWPVESAVPTTVAFLVSESAPPQSLQALLDEEKLQRGREELNALYVALTRARSTLVVSRSILKRSTSAQTWWSRLQPLAAPLPELEPQAGAVQATRPYVLMQLPAAPVRAAAAAPADVGVALPEAVQESAALGEALHRVMEWATGPGGTKSDLDSLVAAAAQMYGLEPKRQQALHTHAQSILQSPACRVVLHGEQLIWAGNEVPVLGRGGEDLRIDRLVCVRRDDGERTWWVVDYKLNEAPERVPEYLQQISGYREAVMAMQPGEEVRTAFINGAGSLIDCTAELLRAERLTDRMAG